MQMQKNQTNQKLEMNGFPEHLNFHFKKYF